RQRIWRAMPPVLEWSSSFAPPCTPKVVLRIASRRVVSQNLIQNVYSIISQKQQGCSKFGSRFRQRAALHLRRPKGSSPESSLPPARENCRRRSRRRADALHRGRRGGLWAGP